MTEVFIMSQDQIYNSDSNQKVRLPSIKELSVGLPTFQQDQPSPNNYSYNDANSRNNSITPNPNTIITSSNSTGASTSPSNTVTNLLKVENGIKLPSISQTDSITPSPIQSRQSSITTLPIGSQPVTVLLPQPLPQALPQPLPQPLPQSSNFINHQSLPPLSTSIELQQQIPQSHQITNPTPGIHHLHPRQKIQQTHHYHHQQQQQQHRQHQQHHHQQQHHHHHHQQQQPTPKKKRPRRKANEMVRLYACNYKNCRNSYGTLNHLNAHITFKKHGLKRKPEEFKQIRELYKLKKKITENIGKPIITKNVENNGKIEIKFENQNDPDDLMNGIGSGNGSGSEDDKEIKVQNEENIKLLANLSEKLIEEKGDDGLPVFHQQRGYNGYGRFDHSLNSKSLDTLPLEKLPME